LIKKTKLASTAQEWRAEDQLQQLWQGFVITSAVHYVCVVFFRFLCGPVDSSLSGEAVKGSGMFISTSLSAAVSNEKYALCMQVFSTLAQSPQAQVKARPSTAPHLKHPT
jgi:hypothetical protein